VSRVEWRGTLAADSPSRRQIIARRNVHQLKLLGGASVVGPDGPLTGRAVQRRRLALLAILATVQARGRGVARERIVAYLWPDADAERGRHLLSDSVYRINQAVDAEAIVAAGDELRLNPTVLSSDVAEFELAVVAGDRDRAAALYAGSLLDGLFLVDGTEFERWLDGERERLGRAYSEVLDALAQAAEERGAIADAVAWWRRLASHDPFSSRVAVRLMQALAAVGDSAAAVQHAVAHTAMLREELGVEPNVAVKKLAEQLKTVSVEPVNETAAAPRENVVTSPEPAADVPTVHGAAPVPNAQPAPVAMAERGRRPALIVFAALALAALAIVVTVVWRRPVQPPPPPAASIAVLPFTDLSPARDNAYFSDGITEELINTLARVEGVSVAARTSVFAYKDRRIDVREVGRELGVATVLEGSVRKEGGKIRITAQLANATDGYQVWSESYDRELDDVFSIQEDISRAIVGTLRGRLTRGTPVQIAEQSTDDVGAYDLYLKGRYAWHERTEDGLHRAIQHFGDAVARAPAYARAYVGLGDAYAVLGFYDYLAPRESFPKAEEAARRAVALDSSLAAPYATLGYVALYHHWDWARAEELFRRSIALDPSYSTAHQWYANLLAARGRFEEAEREMRIAQERDPLSLVANAALGWAFYYAGDFARAIAQCDHTLELNRDFQLAHLWKGWALEGDNRPREAVASIEHAVRLSGGATLPLLSLAHVLASAGARDSATAILASIERKAAHGYVPSYEVAKVHLALGRTAEAMRWLERAFTERSHSMAFLSVDPQLRALRGTEQFDQLVSRVNGGGR
jgi:TolB-like protein/DNA-binding SARP family transcriptional activator